MLGTDGVSCLFISSEDSVDEVSGRHKLLFVVTNDEHVLFVDIVVGKRMALLVRAFATDQNSAAGLLLEAFLVDTFRSNDQTYEVYSLVLWQVYLGLEFVTTDSISRESSRHTSGEVAHSLNRCHFESDQRSEVLMAASMVVMVRCLLSQLAQVLLGWRL